MDRNTNHFTQTPTVSMNRSTFDTPKNIKTTFNVGQLIPFWVNANIYPGDTIRLNNISLVVRATTPKVPTMDNAFADIFIFGIPKRICWEHFREMMGENRTGIWAPSIEYTEKQIKFNKTSSPSTSHTIKVGDLAHYMGLPLFDPTLGAGETERKIEVSALPFITYIKCWNEYFRCQSIEAPAFEPYDDSTITTISDADRTGPKDSWHTLNINSLTDIQYKPAPVNRFADFWSTATPQPQFGDASRIAVGTSAEIKFQAIPTATESSYWKNVTNGAKLDPGTNSQTIQAIGTKGGQMGITNFPNSAIPATLDNSANLYADLANALGPTVNALRLSIATQRIGEREIYGNRFREIIKNFFHVTTNDGRMQIPEFLFSFRQPLNITEVPQTSSTDATTPQGHLAGYSHTVATQRGFVKSFTEWSILLGLICVRTTRSYSQGIEPQWTRKRKLDYFWPQLVHIGEQPVLTKTLFADGSANDETVFGYQEAWADMKYERNLNTGYMDPKAPTSLAFWNYGDLYASAPVLSPEWMNETPANFDRTLAVSSAVSPQLIADINLDLTVTKAGQAIYNTPGLMDHF